MGLDRQGVSQPVYRLLGGRCHEKIPAYANGWYGGARTPVGICPAGSGRRGEAAIEPSSSTRSAQPGSSRSRGRDRAVETVAAVRKAVGASVGLMIEFHGRLAAGTATAMIRRLEPFDPAWCEEPVAPECLDLLAEVKRSAALPDRRG